MQTLGQRERHDLEAVLDHLVQDANVTHVGIIGRSMGAATAVSVAGSPPYSSIIAGMVLDSCYTSVEKVVTEVIMTQIFFLGRELVAMDVVDCGDDVETRISVPKQRTLLMQFLKQKKACLSHEVWKKSACGLQNTTQLVGAAFVITGPHHECILCSKSR
jgi:hypothetical protein